MRKRAAEEAAEAARGKERDKAAKKLRTEIERVEARRSLTLEEARTEVASQIEKITGGSRMLGRARQLSRR